MAHTLQNFKSALAGGGARPNLFEVSLTLPTGLNTASTSLGFDADSFKMLCKSAALPASNIGSIDVPFRGRILKVAGDRTFDTWTITVINDEDFAIRNTMEAWMQYIGQYGDASGSSNPGDYMVDAFVSQLKRSATSPLASAGTNGEGGGLTVAGYSGYAATYKFYSIFPTNISAIDLSYDSSDTIEEFTVEFQVQYWTPFASTQSSGGETPPEGGNTPGGTNNANAG